MFGLVFPLAQGRALGWPAWLFGMLAASVLVLAGFAAYQVRRQRGGRTPLVEPSIFRHPSYRAGMVFSIVFVGSLGGIVMIFNVFLQNGLGFTPWHSALTTAPWAAGAFVGSAVGGIAMSKLGRRVLHAGLVVEAAGLLAIYAVLRGAGGGVSTVDLLAPMVVGGIGMGMVFVPLFDIVMAGVRPQEMGSASGVLQTVNSLGMSLGIAGSAPSSSPWPAGTAVTSRRTSPRRSGPRSRPWACWPARSRWRSGSRGGRGSGDHRYLREEAPSPPRSRSGDGAWRSQGYDRDNEGELRGVRARGGAGRPGGPEREAGLLLPAPADAIVSC